MAAPRRHWLIVPLAALLRSHTACADPSQDVAIVEKRLQAEGSGKQAQDLLEINRQQCKSGVLGRSCRLYLDFASGYVAQQEAEVADAPQKYLEQAAAQYVRVLTEAPGHAATVNNLYIV